MDYAAGSGATRALDDLWFAASGGQVVLALGPSGCGKTTLLSVIAGLLRPTSGRALVAGRNVGELRGRELLEHRRRGVGVVFQAFNLVPSLTALENVMAPLVLTGTRVGRARRVATALLEEMSLVDHLAKRPGQLSGGQQQRVAFARALVHDPPVLLADEPTAHLDPTQVDGILVLIDRLRSSGRLVLVATHDERFHAVGDRVLDLGHAARPQVEGHA